MNKLCLKYPIFNILNNTRPTIQHEHRPTLAASVDIQQHHLRHYLMSK